MYWYDLWYGVYFMVLATLYFSSNRLYSMSRPVRLGQWAVVGWIGHDMINGNIHINDWTLWLAFGIGLILVTLDFRQNKGSEKRD